MKNVIHDLEGGPFIFRINENGSGPNLLLQVCVERGWREYSEYGVLRDNWNLWWRTTGFTASHYKQLKNWQFTNHIPKGSTICRKDNLARYLRCMRNVYGSIYDISPQGFNLPLEYNKLVAQCTKQRQNAENCVWICKPAGQSQGKGIFLFRTLSDLVFDSNAVVQRYIQNPLLIGGYKFDLRLYVCIPSFHPLTVYLYREGLVRFSTEKFSLNDLDNPFCHLTNSSLNKQGAGYSKKKDCVGSGCKWSLKQLRHYFVQVGISDWLLWQRVSSLIVLTVLSQAAGIPSTSNCFEFYGFDVLVDSTLRPWLLEVNLSPALGNDCDVDPAVKKPMLHDMFDLLGLPVCNTGLSLFTIWSASNCQHQDDTHHSNASSNSCSDSERKTPPGTPSSKNSALSVVTAASRWKRRHQKQKQHHDTSGSHSYESQLAGYRTYGCNILRARKKSANHNHNYRMSSSAVIPSQSMPTIFGTMTNRKTTSCTAKPSCKPSNQFNLCSKTTVTLGEDETTSGGDMSQRTRNSVTWLKYDPFLIDRSKNQNRGFQGRNKRPPPVLWGNGRDWRSPQPSEGNWVRIYPLGEILQKGCEDEVDHSPMGSIGDKEIRKVVIAMNRFNKTARDISRKKPDASDDEYNNLLQETLGLTGDIWLPPK